MTAAKPMTISRAEDGCLRSRLFPVKSLIDKSSILFGFA
jgi:hypothetical protein